MLPFNFIHKCAGIYSMHRMLVNIFYYVSMLDELERARKQNCVEKNGNTTLTFFLEINRQIVIQERDC